MDYPLILTILQRIHVMLISWNGYDLCYPDVDTIYAILKWIRFMQSCNGYGYAILQSATDAIFMLVCYAATDTII